jgi:SAM-dependent methyltransferase
MANPASMFDDYARAYDAELQRGLSLSGESKVFFAEQRVARLGEALAREGRPAGRILDFGCGTGGSVPYLRALPGCSAVWGVDPSEVSLSVARKAYPDVSFQQPDRMQDGEVFDIVFCNGVFHHIPPGDRPDALAWIRARLRPEGWFVLWENNPWNPGTRWVMSRIPFDRDAVTLPPPETRRMLLTAGFELVHQTFWFWFPAWLKALRPLEPHLSRIPLGAQYQTIVRRADGDRPSRPE